MSKLLDRLRRPDFESTILSCTLLVDVGEGGRPVPGAKDTVRERRNEDSLAFGVCSELPALLRRIGQRAMFAEAMLVSYA